MRITLAAAVLYALAATANGAAAVGMFIHGQQAAGWLAAGTTVAFAVSAGFTFATWRLQRERGRL